MKKLITKFLLFLTLLFIVEKIIESFFPYTHGNVCYRSKMQYLEQEDRLHQYDLFFWGSSRMHNQINPRIIDNILQQGGTENFASFNLGAPATYVPETYYLYEKLLQRADVPKKMKYAVMEMNMIGEIRNEIVIKERFTYWLNWEYLKFVLEGKTLDPLINWRRKLVVIKDYLIAFVANTFNIGHFHDALVSESYYEQQALGEEKNGFVALELSTEKFNQHQEQIEKGIETSIRYASTDKFDDYNQVHLTKLLQLIKLSESKGIQLIFLLPPRMFDPDAHALKLFHQLPEENRLNFVSSSEYPELYSLENSYDEAHVNKEGSCIYSTIVAKALQNLIKQSS